VDTRHTTIPAGLELVRSFVNTRDVEAGEDSLRPWLESWGVKTSPAAVARAAEVREALRALLLENTGEAADTASAEEVVDAAARRTRLAVRFVGGGAVVTSSGRGVDRVLGDLLGHVATAMSDGSWQRLKACANPDCRWVFWDRARNRSRRWCSMAACGTLMKTRAFRRRRAQ
jgi:predicted RNA-binding Zn ribbon-like protein